MLAALLAQAQIAANRTAKNAVLGIGAGLCIAVGLAFMTLAAWLMLVTIMPALNAAVILGCAYFGLGLILLAIISVRNRAFRRARARAAVAQAQAGPQTLPQMIAAFMTGMQAGRRARF